MNVSKCLGCGSFPCSDVNKDVYILPDVEINPDKISIILISEAAPGNPKDYYYSPGNPDFQKTTVQAFNDAGLNVSSIKDLLNQGVYLTSAVKCGKTAYGIRAGTIRDCSFILEKELDLFPNASVLLLMGDVAKKAINYISARADLGKVIPDGSTYKIRSEKYHFRNMRAFPSYLQVGPSFNIEKSKRRMIAEDIASALSLVKNEKIDH